jgi:hypothetical protein
MNGWGSGMWKRVGKLYGISGVRPRCWLKVLDYDCWITDGLRVWMNDYMYHYERIPTGSDGVMDWKTRYRLEDTVCTPYS